VGHVAGYGYGRWYGKTTWFPRRLNAGFSSTSIDASLVQVGQAGIAPTGNMKLVAVHEGEQAQYEGQQPPDSRGKFIQITPEKQRCRRRVWQGRTRSSVRPSAPPPR
jgi:hypothetical protein